MIEIQGDMFEDYLDPGVLYVLTTNGYVKNDGRAVMGAGTARVGAELHPDLPAILGDLILSYGNRPYLLPYGFASLPVKHDWREHADPTLISTSLSMLRDLWAAYTRCKRTLYLPRPGCGNGGLSWFHIQPLVRAAFEDTENVVVWSLEED